MGSTIKVLASLWSPATPFQFFFCHSVLPVIFVLVVSPLFHLYSHPIGSSRPRALLFLLSFSSAYQSDVYGTHEPCVGALIPLHFQCTDKTDGISNTITAGLNCCMDNMAVQYSKFYLRLKHLRRD